jgi:hypothetical protein
MERRRFLTLASGIAILAGCTGAADDDETASVDETTESVENNEEELEDDTEGTENTEEEAIVLAGQSHSFEGSGSDVTDEFELNDGIAEVEFSHDGESNFIVEMLDLEGDEFDDELLVNVIGSIEGRSVIPTADSRYQLDINADGDWSIALDQPEVTEDYLEELPLSAEGSGPDVVGPIELEGVTEIEATHDGESNFIVEARTAEGGFGAWDLIFNEIGEFEGSATTRTNGVAWIDVNADGDWTLEIR